MIEENPTDMMYREFPQIADIATTVELHNSADKTSSKIVFDAIKMVADCQEPNK